MPKYEVLVQRTVLEEVRITLNASSTEEACEEVKDGDWEGMPWRVIEVNEGPVVSCEEI